MPFNSLTAMLLTYLCVLLKNLTLTLLQVLSIAFFAVIGVQVIYLLTFITAFSKLKKRQKLSASSPSPVPVSIVVCAHDEEENLKELIPLLLQQKYDEFEVIIVDDRSNDSTFDLLLEETKKDHRLRMVHVNRTPPHVNSKKYSITLGIKAAKYEWILLTDADCRPQGDQWIRSMSQQFSTETQFVIGYSPYQEQPGFLNSFIRFETLLTAIQYVAFAVLKNPYMGVGRNLAYRRSLFLEKKGFNHFLPVTGGDDDLFVNEHARGKNTQVVVGAEALMYSRPHQSWGGFFRQKKRHLSVGKLYRFKHKLLLGIFVISWLLTWFMGIPLMILSPFKYYLMGAFAVRIILLAVTIHIAVKQFGHQFKTWLVPFLDFIFSFYYLTTGLVTLVSKKVRWKN
jgi:cellulose synthase/poly-beta-1,6-N-acetylglucosamine synthase-like glycosyltransferase